MDLPSLRTMLMRRWPIVVAATLALGVLASGIAWLSDPVYEAQAALTVSAGTMELDDARALAYRAIDTAATSEAAARRIGTDPGDVRSRIRVLTGPGKDGLTIIAEAGRATDAHRLASEFRAAAVAAATTTVSSVVAAGTVSRGRRVRYHTAAAAVAGLVMGLGLGSVVAVAFDRRREGPGAISTPSCPMSWRSSGMRGPS